MPCADIGTRSAFALNSKGPSPTVYGTQQATALTKLGVRRFWPDFCTKHEIQVTRYYSARIITFVWKSNGNQMEIKWQSNRVYIHGQGGMYEVP